MVLGLPVYKIIIQNMLSTSLKNGVSTDASKTGDLDYKWLHKTEILRARMF